MAEARAAGPVGSRKTRSGPGRRPATSIPGSSRRRWRRRTGCSATDPGVSKASTPWPSSASAWQPVDQRPGGRQAGRWGLEERGRLHPFPARAMPSCGYRIPRLRVTTGELGLPDHRNHRVPVTCGTSTQLQASWTSRRAGSTTRPQPARFPAFESVTAWGSTRTRCEPGRWANAAAAVSFHSGRIFSMASVTRRGSKWYVMYRNEDGKDVQRVTPATTKTEAKNHAVELGRIA